MRTARKKYLNSYVFAIPTKFLGHFCAQSKFVVEALSQIQVLALPSGLGHPGSAPGQLVIVAIPGTKNSLLSVSAEYTQCTGKPKRPFTLPRGCI